MKLYSFHGTDSTIQDEAGEIRLIHGEVIELDPDRAARHIADGLPLSELADITQTEAAKPAEKE
jgi:hypothetical protein